VLLSAGREIRGREQRGSSPRQPAAARLEVLLASKIFRALFHCGRCVLTQSAIAPRLAQRAP